MKENIGKLIHHFFVTHFSTFGDERIDAVLRFHKHLFHHTTSNFLPVDILIVKIFKIVAVNHEQFTIGNGLDNFKRWFVRNEAWKCCSKRVEWRNIPRNFISVMIVENSEVTFLRKSNVLSHFTLPDKIIVLFNIPDLDQWQYCIPLFFVESDKLRDKLSNLCERFQD